MDKILFEEKYNKKVHHNTINKQSRVSNSVWNNNIALNNFLILY